jgi:hypothetical protein
MPANWPTFITNVTDFIVDEVASNAATAEAGAEKFGKYVAEEYIAAIGPAQSIWGQTRSGGGPAADSDLISTYKAQFKRLLGEDTTGDGERDKQPDIPNNNGIDDDGNEIPFSGKKSDPNNPNPAEPDPEYADPDMTEVSEPVIDPEEMREFIDEYAETYDLYKYKFFDFGLDGSETINEASYIISNRILFTLMLESSGSKRKKLVKWVDSFNEWDYTTLNVNDRTEFKDKVKDIISSAGYNATDLISKVRNNTLSKLKTSYNVSDTDSLKDAANSGKPSNMSYFSSYITDFETRIIQVPFDSENTSEDYKVSKLMMPDLILYFSFNNEKTSSAYIISDVEKKYTENEMTDKWSKIETVSNSDDVVNKKNRAAPYMFTRQKAVDALAEVENGDVGEDPYELLAEATIDYWKSTAIQPLASMPAAPPCVVSQPLGGKYIPIYYGNTKKLTEGIRKALNAGKDADNKREAGEKVAKALSLAYTRHLMQLKFIYQGGIPVPLVPFVPMIGFVPNVF